MVIDNGNLVPFTIKISVDCDNADGTTREVQIDPELLIRNLREKRR